MIPIFLISDQCLLWSARLFLTLLWEVQRLTSPGNHWLCSLSATLQLCCYTRFIASSLGLLPWADTVYCPAWGSTVAGNYFCARFSSLCARGKLWGCSGSFDQTAELWDWPPFK